MVLNFCDTCGAKHVRDVKEELSNLLVKGNKYQPDKCGICLGTVNISGAKPEKTETKKFVVKEEHITDEEEDYVKNSSGDETDEYYKGDSNSSQSDDDEDAAEKAEKDDELMKLDGLKNDYHSVIADLDPQLVALSEESDDPKKSFKCKLCPKKFAYINTLVRHLPTHPGVAAVKKPFKCGLCETACKRRFNLKAHRRMHSNYRPFKCNNPSCTAAFKDKYMLASHKETHAGNIPVKRFKCDICSRLFRKHSNLVKHMRTHTGDRPFMCKFCGFCSAQKHNLVIHERQHTKEKPFRCQYCNKGFYQAAQLQQHEMDHTGERPFVCEICGYTFKAKASLKQHMATHCPDKPYKCDKCDFTSKRKENVKSHQQVHTTVREYQCSLCNQLFKHKDSFKKHERRHEKDTKWVPRVTIQKKQRKQNEVKDFDLKQVHLRPKDAAVIAAGTSHERLPQENNRIVVVPSSHRQQAYPVNNMNSVGIMTTHHQVTHHPQTSTQRGIHDYEPVDVVFNIL